jgi:deoxyadenosine/deoxycytidine kinase
VHKVRYIALAGNMGSGKTSLATFLQKKLGLVPLLEAQDENPYLSDFYADMDRWAFHSQVFFLTRKVRLYQSLSAIGGTAMLDRTIYEDAEIFAKALFQQGKMSRRDHALYRDLYDDALRQIPPPAVMIYCHCSLPMLMNRIARRGRSYEGAVSREYIGRLNRLYASWRRRYALSPVIDLPTDEMDYMTDFFHRHELLEQLKPYVR